jgi:hypothetical protein
LKQDVAAQKVNQCRERVGFGIFDALFGLLGFSKDLLFLAFQTWIYLYSNDVKQLWNERLYSSFRNHHDCISTSSKKKHFSTLHNWEICRASHILKFVMAK